jgi:hypothetical protein
MGTTIGGHMKWLAIFAISLAALLLAPGCVSTGGDSGNPPIIVGNDSDSHGCKASAGYSWCEAKQKCLRAWEENCTPSGEPKMCTADAKMCPDGSAVGRDGNNNCEFFPCPKTNNTLYGRVTIGPLCPVEPCSKEANFSDVRVHVYQSPGKAELASVMVQSDGYYGVFLLPGNYFVNVTDSKGNAFGLPGSSITQQITIEKGHEIELDFDIDTGIR